MPLFRELLAKKGVKSVYNFPIKNLQGKVVGIFGVDYVKRERNLEGKDLEILKEDIEKELYELSSAHYNR